MTSTSEGGLLVYGLGRSGSAVLRRAAALGRRVAFFERREDGPDVAEALARGALRVRSVAEVDPREYPTCVAAPGVPIDHVDLVSLRRLGVRVTGEVEWTYRRVPGRYVGVTGTAGKGSVTTWLTQVLTAAGVDAVAGGNNDPALAAVARSGATHVVELSSFQLERSAGFHPDVAVVLNLGQDHLDRHGTVEAYHAAKRRLVEGLEEDGTLVVNSDDPVAAAWASEATVRTLRYSLERPADAYLGADSWIHLFGRRLLRADHLNVPGRHQVGNAMAVALAASAMGVDRADIAAALPLFRGLPGRYSVVAEAAGITFVEDSIATRPLAVAAALTASGRPLVWLAGGQDKGADLEGLVGLVAERVDLLVAFGASGPLLANTYRRATQVELIEESDGTAALDRAVRTAVARLAGAGGTILLAPLAASFDQFRDYAHRAQVYRSVVAAVSRELSGTPEATGA